MDDENGSSDSIKSFIYLDTDKMYSTSSQLFSGLTDHVTTTSGRSSSELDEQQGGFATGRKMVDIIEKTENHAERRYLHDYAYTLFETALFDKGKVLEINGENFHKTLSTLANARFKITGRIVFNDSQILENTLRDYNRIGYALGYVAIPEELRISKQELLKKAKDIKDRNKRSNQKELISNKFNINEIIYERGLLRDEAWLEQLAFVLNFGYSGKFEIQLPLTSDKDHVLFSAILNRTMLKEDEQILIKN
jgi:hypothetical protein